MSIVQVETDLAAIPAWNIDKNYVDNWLEKQMVEYEKEMGENSATKMLKNIAAILGLSGCDRNVRGPKWGFWAFA